MALNGALNGGLFRQNGHHNLGARTSVAIKQHQPVGHRRDHFSLQTVWTGHGERGDQVRPRRDDGIKLGAVLHPEMGPFQAQMGEQFRQPGLYPDILRSIFHFDQTRLTRTPHINNCSPP